jgi:hypothetical protein
MRHDLHGVEVRGEAWEERCATVIEAVGGYAVVVSTVLQTRAITMVSSYLADLSGDTAVSHMTLTPGGEARFTQRVLGALPGASHARACLLDHAAELRLTLEEVLAEPLTVKMSEEALESAGDVWRLRDG